MSAQIYVSLSQNCGVMNNEINIALTFFFSDFFLPFFFSPESFSACFITDVLDFSTPIYLKKESFYWFYQIKITFIIILIYYSRNYQKN